MEDYTKRLLEKYPPVDLTVEGNAIPNEWEWDDDYYDAEVYNEYLFGSNE